MRRLLLTAAAGLLLAPLVGLGLAQGSDVPAKSAPPAKPAEPAQPSPFVEKDKSDDTSCSHGTKIKFVDSPKDAAVQAKKEQKLVFVLHVSGNFEDPRFT